VGKDSVSVKKTMIRVGRTSDGRLEVEDWRGRSFKCRVEDLGDEVDKILADPELPDVDVVSPGAANITELLAREVLPPESRHLAAPAAGLIQDLVGHLPDFIARIRYAMYQRRAASYRPPEDPQTSQAPPHRTAYRRGQRFG
jgi:hypothetical protein